MVNLLCAYYISMQGVGELLHIACARGQLDVVKYLIEDCHVDPACVGHVRLYICIFVCMYMHMCMHVCACIIRYAST